MKNILNSLFPWLAVTTLLSLQGCENEEGTAIHSRDTVSFEIDAGGARATETTFETGDAIGVYAAVRMSSAPATLKTSGNYADNKRFVWNGSQFVADGDANEIAAGYETDYYAYYPYREDMGNPLDYDFSIQGDQREGITLSDFMYAANRSGTTDKVITLAFSHRKYSINSLVYWVTYVHNVVYSFYRSMIYCYINSTQRCAGSIGGFYQFHFLFLA